MFNDEGFCYSGVLSATMVIVNYYSGVLPDTMVIANYYSGVLPDTMVIVNYYSDDVFWYYGDLCRSPEM